MRAWVTHGYRDMRLEDVPDPVAKAGWVVVRILVAQPSITEILLFQGIRTYAHDLVAERLAAGPAQLFGHEFSGQVVAVGEGVATLSPGDRVTARGSHPDGLVGFHYPGAFAEFGLFPESLLARLPDHVSDEAGAAIQPLTDAVAAVHAAGLTLGDTVVVIGQGSMGLGCLQAARAGGVGLTIAVARRAETLAISRELGADVTIDAAAEDAVERVRELTAGRGADVVFEAAGGPPERGVAGNATLIQAARMLRPEGTVVGVAFDGDAAILPYADFRFRAIRYRFPSVLTRAMFETTVALVADGRVRLGPLLKPPLDGLEALPQAFAMTEHKGRHGFVNPAQIRIAHPEEPA